MTMRDESGHIVQGTCRANPLLCSPEKRKIKQEGNDANHAENDVPQAELS